MIIDTAVRDSIETRLGLAGFRARRTPTVSRGSRARTYSSALAQADELWSASQVATALASPMLRYYSAMQAGLAICAASPRGNAAWKPRQGHGLRLTVPSGQGLLELERVEIAAEGEGMSAQSLAAALNSPLLAEPTPLIQLIAALPTQRLVYDSEGTAATPMHVEFDNHVDDGWVNAYFGVPRALVFNEDDSSRTPSEADLRKHLNHFPSLRGLPDWNIARRIASPKSTGVRLYWRPSALIGWDWPRRYDISSSSEPFDGVVLPEVGGNRSVQHPFLTWYLVLYGFSMLARYYADRWRATLDFDCSPRAVPLVGLIEKDSEECLSLAAAVLEGFLAQAEHPQVMNLDSASTAKVGEVDWSS